MIESQFECVCGLNLRRYFGKLPSDTEGMLHDWEYYPLETLWRVYEVKKGQDAVEVAMEAEEQAIRLHRWKRIECPLCRALRCGYYIAPKVTTGKCDAVYELHALLWWHSGTHDAVPEDLAHAITWTAESLHAHTMLKTT